MTELKQYFNKCLELLDEDLIAKGVDMDKVLQNKLRTYIRPAPNHILECFKYFDANNLRVIIVGQDPYPDPSYAHGLSFSAPRDVKIPSSLQMIYKCLYKQFEYERIEHPNLLSWAKQGILMLNMYLTRTPNIEKTIYIEDGEEKISTIVNGNGKSSIENMHKFWGEFTCRLLKYLSNEWMEKINHNNHNVIVLLWGNHAHGLEQYINTQPNKRGNKFTVLKWGHPSPISTTNTNIKDPKNFLYCDHFSLVNSIYSDICWNPNYTPPFDLRDQFFFLRKPNVIINPLDSPSPYNDLTKTPENLKIIQYLKSLKKQSTNEISKQINEESIEVKSETIDPTPKDSSNFDSSNFDFSNFEKSKSEESKPNIVVVFTDGGCRGNGKSDAKAAVGIYFPAIFDGVKTALGEIKIKFSIPDKTQVYSVDSKTIVSTSIYAKRTNQRAELLSTIHAFKTILDKWTSDINISEICLITDSLQYVVSWVGNRIWKEYKVNKKYLNIPNRDLVIILHIIILQLGRKIKPTATFEETQQILIESGFLKVIHQNSHISGGAKAKLSGKNLELVNGNEIADNLCNEAMDGI